MNQKIQQNESLQNLKKKFLRLIRKMAIGFYNGHSGILVVSSVLLDGFLSNKRHFQQESLEKKDHTFYTLLHAPVLDNF